MRLHLPRGVSPVLRERERQGSGERREGFREGTALTFSFPLPPPKTSHQLALHPRDVRPAARAPRPCPLRHRQPPQLGGQGERAAAQGRGRRRRQQEASEGRADVVGRGGARRVRRPSEEGLSLLRGGLERDEHGRQRPGIPPVESHGGKRSLEGRRGERVR